MCERSVTPLITPEIKISEIFPQSLLIVRLSLISCENFLKIDKTTPSISVLNVAM